MTMTDLPPPPQPAEEAGAPLWMATFADLMSLLLAFFVLLFSFAKVEDEEIGARGASMAEAFGVQYEKKVHGRVEGTSAIAKDLGSAPSTKKGSISVIQEFIKEKLTLKSIHDTDQGADIKKKLGKDKKVPLRIQEEMSKVLSAELLAGSAKLIEERGEFTLQLFEPDLFKSGSNTLRSSLNPLLDKVTKILQSVKGPVRVQGYAERPPNDTKLYPTSWDLGAARAVTIGQELLERKLVDDLNLTVGAQSVKEQPPSEVNKNPQITITFSKLRPIIKKIKAEIEQKDSRNDIAGAAPGPPFIPIDVDQTIRFGADHR